MGNADARAEDPPDEGDDGLARPEAMDALLVLDPATMRIRGANSAATELYGYELNELLEMTADDIVSPQADEEDPLPSAVQSRVALRRHRRKDGTEFPAAVATSSLDIGGQKMLCCTVRDVTVERWTREELLRIRAAVDGASDGVLIIDRNGKAIYSNRAFENLLGYTLDELNEAGPGSIYSRPDVTGKAISAALRGEVWRDEMRVRCKEGRRFPADIHASPVLDDGGHVIDILFLITDIAERRQAEAKIEGAMAGLERSNRQLQHFAYVASHDLQEPLRMVGGYVELLAKRYKGRLDEEADDFIEFATGGVARMRSLIRDLLLYSRVGTRGKALVPTDSEQVLLDALANLQVSINETGTKVTHGDMPVVTADESQLGQLFQNLVGNAIKFRGEQAPRVHISAERQDLEWLFRVEDNGIGFKQGDAERIFDVFQRLHGWGEYDGTGIGLAICKQIVERHGGRIWVESEPGKGSAFFFTIPARPDE
jgi:PAS domain S-box-containing protein